MSHPRDKWDSKIRPNFPKLCDRVKVKSILPHLHCLSNYDVEKIECDTRNDGDRVGMQTLLDRLRTRDPRVYYNQLMLGLSQEYSDLALEIDPTFNPEEYNWDGTPKPRPSPPSQQATNNLSTSHSSYANAGEGVIAGNIVGGESIKRGNLEAGEPRSGTTGNQETANQRKTGGAGSADNGNGNLDTDRLTSIEDNNSPSITYNHCIFATGVQLGNENTQNIDAPAGEEVEQEEEEEYEIVRGDRPTHGDEDEDAGEEDAQEEEEEGDEDEDANEEETKRMKLGFNYPATRPRNDDTATASYSTKFTEDQPKAAHLQGTSTEDQSCEKILNTDLQQDACQQANADIGDYELEEKGNFAPEVCGDSMPTMDLNLEGPEIQPSAPRPMVSPPRMAPPPVQPIPPVSCRTAASGSSFELPSDLSETTSVYPSTVASSNSTFELSVNLSMGSDSQQDPAAPPEPTPTPAPPTSAPAPAVPSTSAPTPAPAHYGTATAPGTSQQDQARPDSNPDSESDTASSPPPPPQQNEEQPGLIRRVVSFLGELWENPPM